MARKRTPGSRLRIAVLYGGSSTERQVSLESGTYVAQGLQQCGHHVTLIDPSEEDVAKLKSDRWDVFFPVVHGTGGEDGVLQRQLLRTGIPYVGSSPESSILTFDKLATRNHLAASGISMPHAVAVREDTSISAILAPEGIPEFPIVTKPTRQGSSVGVSITHNRAELQDGIRRALCFGDTCLAEQYIAGREISVPIVDGTAYPAVEITPASAWYDYHAKYQDQNTCYTVNPDGLPHDLSQAAVEACQRCGVRGIARVDFRLDESGHAWLLEINSVPGMSSHSLVPMSAATRGLSTGQLCEQTIQHLLQTTRQKRRVAG